MLDAQLISEQTVEAGGSGPDIELGEAAGKKFFLTLTITRIIEQQSLDVSVWGSPDKVNWGQKPLAAFPQKFYAGAHQILLDLGENPEVKYLRAKWKTNRWGKGAPTPRFTFSLDIRQLAGEAAA